MSISAHFHIMNYVVNDVEVPNQPLLWLIGNVEMLRCITLPDEIGPTQFYSHNYFSHKSVGKSIIKYRKLPIF